MMYKNNAMNKLAKAREKGRSMNPLAANGCEVRLLKQKKKKILFLKNVGY